MYIRYKESRNPNKRARIHVTTVGNHRYEFWEKDGWICDVQIKKHVEWLLSGKGAGNYEVAYEKYGIHFQPTGQEIKQNGHAVGVTQEAIVQVAAGVPVEVVNRNLEVEAIPKGKMSLTDRIAKMQAGRNKNRAAKGLPPIEFKS